MKLLSFFRPVCFLFSTILLAACGGSSNDDEASNGGGNQTPTPTPSTTAVTVSGNVFLPDDRSPLGNALVYISGDDTINKSQLKSVGINCEQAPSNAVTSTCTNSNGSFDLENVPAGEHDIIVARGAFIATIPVVINQDQTGSVELQNTSLSSDLVDGDTRMAVVTGFYDAMENVLAKTGFGTIDDAGLLVPGTETFTLYDGDFSLGQNHPHQFQDLFEIDSSTGQAEIFNYDIVFINCGAEEYLAEETVSVDPTDELTRTTLRSYVEQGGRLYATDLAYDYIEQAFPEFIDFYNGPSSQPSDNDITLPEPHDGAEYGDSNTTVDSGELLDPDLQSFLSQVQCGALGDEACLNDDNTIHIEGFLAGWSIMDGAHNQDDRVTFYTRGDVLIEGEDSPINKPLTASFDLGSGRVFFSSYHSEAEGNIGLLPQERVLQYLIFE